jgi:hypothetical protein
MENLTKELESDRIHNCNDVNLNKNQDHFSYLTIVKFSKKDFVIFHQNIRGLYSNKLDELCISLYTDPPHVICLTVHHLGINEIHTIKLANYNLGAKFCRNIYKNGRVCIFLNEEIQSTSINLNKFCKEKDLKVCAANVHFQSYEICILTIYRSSYGNFQYFIDNLEKILTMIYSATKEIIIYGDIIMNYLTDSTYKQVLDSLLASYGLCSTVRFPTRIQNKCFSAIDNLFINTFKFSNFSRNPVINGLSDHDMQILIIHNIFEKNCNNYFYMNRKIDKYSVNDYSIKLSYESWEDIFSENNVNIIFNSFLDKCLKIMYSSFPTKKFAIDLAIKHG